MYSNNTLPPFTKLSELSAQCQIGTYKISLFPIQYCNYLIIIYTFMYLKNYFNFTYEFNILSF